MVRPVWALTGLPEPSLSRPGVLSYLGQLRTVRACGLPRREQLGGTAGREEAAAHRPPREGLLPFISFKSKPLPLFG